MVGPNSKDSVSFSFSYCVVCALSNVLFKIYMVLNILYIFQLGVTVDKYNFLLTFLDFQVKQSQWVGTRMLKNPNENIQHIHSI